MTGFLGQALIYVVPFLLMLTVIVTVHELGHFWVARACGVKIDRFSIGFGRALWSRTDKHGTEWRLAWIPLGGYVKFAGDVDASSVPDQQALDRFKAQASGQGEAVSQYFHFKPVWQRALITFAGPAANFILSLVLLTVLFSVIGEQIAAPRVRAVAPGSPAAEAGFQPNDLITAVNGRAVREDTQVTGVVMLSAGDPVRFTVDRGGRTIELVATPERQVEQNQIAGRVRVARVGLSMGPLPQDITVRRLNPVEAMGKGGEVITDTVSSTFRYLGRIFAGKESGDLLNGPVGIATATGGVAKQAASVQAPPMVVAGYVALTFLQLAALVSIGMGVVNLLPIPVLDGGRLVFFAYEAVARRPVPERVQELGYRVGLALLAGLMLFATWNDLQKLSLFKFLGGLA